MQNSTFETAFVCISQVVYFSDKVQTLFITAASFWKISEWIINVSENATGICLSLPFTYFPDNVKTLFTTLNSFWRISHWFVSVSEIPIAGFHCPTTIKSIQQIKSRKEKEDEYSISVAKIQVCAMFRAGDIRRNVLLKFKGLCMEQIYKAMYGDAMFVSLWGAQIWRPEANKNICHRVFCKELLVWGLINIYMRTYSHARTFQIVKSKRKSYFF